ncbi:hypothetical protein [Synechococcus phage S-N03]|uniref:Uncharacterized protein n=1 Tax=Synechococcus phage S-N03 TaxID=2718943 RepID=A0A6G8R623_9CAUD|nr:hypothetical protein PQC09_gp244 [Synechococcus phage S-N03]QIN96823.1 hypothetical protein [Synechococcus phage S-N03]
MFPWSTMVLILGPGIIFACWCVYYVLRTAHLEIKEDRQIL